MIGHTEIYIKEGLFFPRFKHNDFMKKKSNNKTDASIALATGPGHWMPGNPVPTMD